MVTEVKQTDQNNQNKKKKFKIKMPSALAIMVGVIFFVTILTWIPHGVNGMTTGTPDWANGSLASWQEHIFQDAITKAGFSIDTITAKDATDIIDKYGLQGYWDDANKSFVTQMDLPWTLTSFSDGSSSMFGIFDTFKAMLGGYWAAWDVAFYIVGIYAVVLLLMETNTLRDGVSSLVKGLGGKEILLVPILFILFSLGGTLFGMQEETLGLLPIIVPVLILAGFDAGTGLMVATIGTTTGISASVLDPFSIGVMANGLGTGIGTAILERTLLFVIYTTVGAIFVTWYALRVKKNPMKSMDKDSVEINKKWAAERIGDISELETMSRAQKISLWIFGIVFGWMVFTLMPWTKWFLGLEDNQGWIIFSSIFYGKTLIGKWYFVELSILFLVAAFIIGKLFNMSNSKIISTFWTSLKDMFGVITIIAFSRAVSMILTSTGLTYGMIYGTINEETLSSVNPLVFTLIWLAIFTMMAFFISSTSGLAGITSPIAGAVITAAGTTSGAEHEKLLIIGILIAYPLAQGVVNMFSPTSGIVVVQAQQSKVSFGKALPWLGGFAATLFVVGVIFISLIMGLETSILL